jgi:uncharacterized protein (TIGR00251 family)
VSLPVWIAPGQAGTSLLTIHLQPGAKHTAILGSHGDALKIRLAAPPIDGRANAALVRFLATTLALPLSGVTLINGEKSRRKKLAITLDQTLAASRLEAVMQTGV